MHARSSRRLWMALVFIVGAVWALVACPTWHVQPFRPQTDAGLRAAFAVKRVGPWVTAVGVGLAGLVVAALWTRTRAWARTAAVLLLSSALLPTWFVRQRHFEWMFRPLGQVQYVPAGDARFVTDADVVMGVERRGAARAFPILQLAYHHIVNTAVGDEPIVATY